MSLKKQKYQSKMWKYETAKHHSDLFNIVLSTLFIVTCHKYHAGHAGSDVSRNAQS